MSSSSVTQILQVVAPQAEAKPQQPGEAEGKQFQQLLAQASQASEQRGPETVEANDVEAPDQQVAENTDQQTATSQDDQSTTAAEAPALATAEVEQALDDQLSEQPQDDEVLLSEAAGVVLAAQASPAVDFPVQSVDATAEPEIEVATTVTDAPATGDQPQQPAVQPQAAVSEFAPSLEVTQAAQQVVATETVVVDPPADTPAEEQLQTKPATAGLADGLTDDSSTASSPEKLIDQVQQTGEHLQPTTDPTQEVVADKQVIPAAPDKSAQPATKQAEAVPLEQAAATTDEPETDEKPVKAAAAEAVVHVKQEQPAGEVKAALDKKAEPAPRAHELPAIHHGSSEATAHTTREAPQSASHSLATPDTGTDSDPVSTLDRARFVQRVSRAFQSTGARDGVVRLRLSPPELGSLRIAISTHHGVVSAKVEADTAAARNVLLDNLPALRHRLAQQQIRLEKFDVDVRRDGGQNTGNWHPQERQSPQLPERPVGPTRLHQPTALPLPAGRTLGGVSDSGLDVRI